MNRLVFGTSVTLATRLLVLLIGVAGSVILARALGPSGRGEYALIILIPAILQITGNLGLDAAVTYLVAKRQSQARSIALSIAAASAALGLVLLAGYALLAELPTYNRFLEVAGVDPYLVWILVALLPFTLASSCLIHAILGLERYRAFNLASLLGPLSNLALLLVLVVALRLGVLGAVLAAGGSSLVGLAGATVILLSATVGPTKPAHGLMRETLSYGARVHVGSVSWFLHWRADMFLVSYLAGPAALGYYAAAVGLTEKLYVLPSTVGTVLLPRVAGSKGEETRSVTPVACRHTLWLTFGFAVLLAVFAWPIVYLLFGAAFLPSVRPLWLLLPGMIALGAGRVLSADLNGRGLPGAVAGVNTTSAILNVVLNLWWIPIWGTSGAAAATSISYAVAALLLGHRYTRAAGVRWSELLLYTRSDRQALANVVTRFREPES